MAFNGSGVFVRLYSWVNDAAANIKIRADRMDNEMNGMATALSTCITKDGQTTITNNLPMAGFRHTGVGAGSSRTDYTRLDQSQDGKLAWVDGGGTADAITASYSIPIASLVDGQLCYVRATAANTTTTPTFSPSALAAATIVKQGGTALQVGDIAGDGHELILRYDLANTRWELLNPKSQVIPFVTASASAPASLDFAEDTDNGTNKITLSAPSSIAADVTVTLPGTADTLVGRNTTDTLTNKTLNSAVINGGAVTGSLAMAEGYVDGLTKFGNVNVTSNATLADVPGLSVSVVAGYLYMVNIDGAYGASPGGVRTGIGGTATMSSMRIKGYLDLNGTFSGGANTASLGALQNNATTVAGSFSYSGYINPATSGTFTVQFAQNTSNATASTLNYGRLQLIRIS